MTKEWKKFEELVARIEELLCPEGAEVKSPDYIKDLETGESRQIDATIRYQVGSTLILIAIECRKHETKQDTTWIEQLVTKTKSIGAAKTVAVSDSGFTIPAIKKAEDNGIEIRVIDEVTDGDILRWAEGFKFHKGRCSNRFVEFPEIDVYGEPGTEVTSDWPKNFIEGGGLTAKIFTYVRDPERKVSIADIVCAKYREEYCDSSLHFDGNTEVRLQHGETIGLSVDMLFEALAKGLPADGSTHTKHFRYCFPRGQLRIPTSIGELDVSRLEFDLELAVSFEKIEDATRVVTYSDQDKPIVHVAETDLRLTRGDQIHSFKLTTHLPASDAEDQGEPTER